MTALPRRAALVLVLLLFAAACSGGDEPVADAPVTDEPGTSDNVVADATPADPPPAPEDVAAEELPMFESDFDRVCTTQVGFGGATSYEPVAGIHPVLLFQETDSGTLITSSAELPAGWAIEQDSNFDDNSELAPIELVACAVVAKTTPNGVTCDFEDDDGSTITLDLVDTTYEMTVHAATTGAVLGTEVIEAVDTECPFVAFIDEGQTEYVNTPDAEQYTNALRPYVMPG